MAKLTKKLCSSHVDPRAISALTACRLIALDKHPGVRPIGVSETLRCLISKAFLRVTHDDIRKAVGSVQLCAGQEAACEAGIHTMRNLFEDDGVEAVLLVDASNVFNSLNREAALRNIHIHCPVLAPMLTNMYRTHSMLFIDGNHILSQEGTTQGDPLAMAMYAIGTLQKSSSEIRSAVGDLKSNVCPRLLKFSFRRLTLSLPILSRTDGRS